MRFLRRKVQATETVREKGRVIHREIEITVEREWVSVPASGQQESCVLVDMPPLALPPETKPE